MNYVKNALLDVVFSFSILKVNDYITMNMNWCLYVLHYQDRTTSPFTYFHFDIFSDVQEDGKSFWVPVQQQCPHRSTQRQRLSLLPRSVDSPPQAESSCKKCFPFNSLLFFFFVRYGIFLWYRIFRQAQDNPESVLTLSNFFHFVPCNAGIHGH